MIRTATRTAEFLFENQDVDEAQLRALQDRLLLGLAGILGSDFSDAVSPLAAPRSAKLFSQGLEYLEFHPAGERLCVKDMAAALDVSQRTLYKAFADWIGLGPYEYDLLSRMHAFRTDMIMRPRGRGRVGAAARAAGFRDQSRLGAMYRRHFGEQPSVTARRWDQTGTATLLTPRRHARG